MTSIDDINRLKDEVNRSTSGVASSKGAVARSGGVQGISSSTGEAIEKMGDLLHRAQSGHAEKSQHLKQALISYCFDGHGNVDKRHLDEVLDQKGIYGALGLSKDLAYSTDEKKYGAVLEAVTGDSEAKTRANPLNYHLSDAKQEQREAYIAKEPIGEATDTARRPGAGKK